MKRVKPGRAKRCRVCLEDVRGRPHFELEYTQPASRISLEGKVTWRGEFSWHEWMCVDCAPRVGGDR